MRGKHRRMCEGKEEYRRERQVGWHDCMSDDGLCTRESTFILYCSHKGREITKVSGKLKKQFLINSSIPDFPLRFPS